VAVLPHPVALGQPGRSVVVSVRNVVLAAVMIAAFVVFWLWHVDLSGSLRVVLAAVVIALPLALAESSGNASGDSARGRPVAVTRGSLVLALFGLVVFTDLYFAQGYSFILLSVVCLVLPLVLVASRAWGARRRRIEFGLLRHPLRRDVRPHLVQAVNVWLCCLLLGGVLAAGGVHYARIGFSLNGVQFRWAMAAYVGGVVLLAALALVPRRRVFVATNLVVALLSGFLALQLVRISVPAPEPVVLDSPLEGGWFVLNGGRSVVLNGHLPNESQAIDFQLMGVNGRTHTGDAGAPLADYPGFGQPVLAPIDGRSSRSRMTSPTCRRAPTARAPTRSCWTSASGTWCWATSNRAASSCR